MTTDYTRSPTPDGLEESLRKWGKNRGKGKSVIDL